MREERDAPLQRDGAVLQDDEPLNGVVVSWRHHGRHLASARSLASILRKPPSRWLDAQREVSVVWILDVHRDEHAAAAGVN
jgi:hypothetical protein